jgi:hypothetical protein
MIVSMQFESSRASSPPILPTSKFSSKSILSPVSLPCYTKKIALAFVHESSDSSLHCSSPPRRYDDRVFSYLI